MTVITSYSIHYTKLYDYDEQTPLEDKYYRLQLELAKKLELPVMIHTPHRDKKRGTSRSMDVCDEHGLDPRKVVVDSYNFV